MGFTAILTAVYVVLLIADAAALAKQQWIPALTLTGVMAAGLIALWLFWANSPM